MSNYHSKYFKVDRSRDLVWQEIVRYLFKFIRKPQAVLELGAGYCSFINSVVAPYRTAVDVWKEFPKYAESSVNCLVSDVRSNLAKIIRRKFDLIMASNLLEHLEMEEVEILLKKCNKMLYKNGQLILIQPNYFYAYRHYFDDYTHKTIFSHITLEALLDKQNFEIIHREARFMPLTFQSRLPKWRSFIRLYFTFPIRPFAGQMLFIAQKK